MTRIDSEMNSGSVVLSHSEEQQLFGLTCLVDCFFLLLLMLWHDQPVRSTLKHLPYWNKLGQQMRRELKHQA
ncbi:MAG: hypothetical protein MR450_05260 [Prevotella sp.]|nr:hypothetical protein [Prevotella sp.]MDY4039380.1 hypothetical protein [Prevotella sp.]